MPHKWYRQDCCGTASTTGAEYCSRCGERGIPLPGWGISSVEHICRFVRVTGLKPWGPHQRHNGEVMKHFISCKPCRGTGVVDHDDPARDGDCMHCRDCDGTGYVFVGTVESLRATRDALLKRFPEARAGQPPLVMRRATD